ncbi:lipase family alpha/beta hydrolase [Nocardioides rubriscoriae]|uniref:lipase family alpha/beta hydrolase n=1 Tax=Nocardioides rubriscoriae TaxID=642762 RepID=UPI001B878A6D|nr:alpha/beta fold hydrolase [Nocardioides rubriscoriae]
MSTWPGWLGRLSPARRRLHLGVACLVVGALVVVGVRAVLDRSADDPAPVDQARRGPVLLVPGYGGSTTALEDLAAALPGAEVVAPPGDGTGDLREAARALADRVREVLERTGAPSVDLVGYSAGGVVVRYYVAELGGAAVTRRVATVASPHHGTDLAALATSIGSGTCSEACRQLDPGSDLLRALNAGDETPAGPRWLSVWTETDQTVVPADSAVLDGARSVDLQATCGTGPLSHGEVVRAPVTVSVVEAFLGAGGSDFLVAC